jgi:hypothetical protein
MTFGVVTLAADMVGAGPSSDTSTSQTSARHARCNVVRAGSI